MRRNYVWLLLILFSASFFAFEKATPSESKSKPQKNDQATVSTTQLPGSAFSLYTQMNLEAAGLSFNTFKNAWNGYCKLDASKKLSKPLLSIVDMSQPSKQKRLYIIDVAAHQLLVHTLVAHGKNSGEFKATKFSNTPESLQSSLGFYITGGTYMGSNGYSMKLKGLERGFNDKAESRAIVMHGAAYVSEEVANRTGRVGRSWGCPAVSIKEHKKIIDLIKNGSCLFISAPEAKYLASSQLVNDIDSLL